ncbi:hypothetical protein LFM09_18615 [Lentzea alba]|uniref:hypothetical protein n=1 Tax=Lentzea alba TaxID=2714351 RepID=UPI0039BF4D3B
MGPLLSTHPVARRHLGGLVALTISLVCSLLVVLAFVLDLGGAELALLAAAYPLLVSAPVAVGMLRNSAIRETFELHEGGLARVRSGVRKSWTWDRVRAIDLTAQGPDLVCAVRFDDGELIRFTSAETENSLAIHHALGEHCVEALERPARTDRSAPALSVLTLAGAGGAAAAICTAFQIDDPETQFGLVVVAIGGSVTAVITGILLGAVLLGPR